jgi:Gas vesicle synthesis protein GvpL/GvpF
MTGFPGEEKLSRTEQALARQAARDLLAEAFDDARTEVRSILCRRLVDALLQEMAHLDLPSTSSASHLRLQSDEDVPPATPPTRSGVYIYGFVLGDGQSQTGRRGVDGSRTYGVVEGEVAAIASSVCGASSAWGFGSDGDPDLDGLAMRAHEHEAVLEAILASSPVLPMRFGTLYPSDEAVRRVLQAHQSTIRAAVAELEGKVELGLTVTWDRGRDENATGRELAVVQPSGGTGRAYLSRREAEKVASERLATDCREVATGLHRAIQVEAIASVVHPTRHPSQSDERARDIVLRASYLVEKSNRDRFEDVIVEALNAGMACGLRGDLTGPWPPYNFARLQLDGAAAK